MPRRAEKLLERMRASKAGWSRSDLDALYAGYGFTIKHGASHDIVSHTEFPELRATLPRHKDLAKAYIAHAVKLIDRLHELRQGGPDAGRDD
jgi:hypothetical protein